jgi:hypothetical protein
MKYSVVTVMGMVGLVGGAASVAQASVLVNSQFSTFGNGNLVGQGGWVQQGASNINPLQVASGVVRVPGGQINDAQDAINTFSAPLAANDSLYLASRLTVNSTQTIGTSPSYILGLRESSASGFVNVRVAFRAGTVANTYQIGVRITGQSANPFQYSGNLPLGTSIDLVVAYDAIGGGTSNDQIFAYLNPVSSDRDFNSFFASQSNAANSDPAGFNGVIISQFGTSTNSTADVSIGNVVIASTFEEAYASVPSPASLALFGLGVLVAGRRRR